MSPRGGKRANQTGRPMRAGTPSAYRIDVWLTEAERGELEDERGEQPIADFAREALSTLPRYRIAVAEIESMIAGCDLTLSTAHGNYRKMVEHQRRTLEFVLGLLKQPKEK